MKWKDYNRLVTHWCVLDTTRVAELDYVSSKNIEEKPWLFNYILNHYLKDKGQLY